MTWKEFLDFEKATRDTIDVKKVYIDMADDLVAGVMLSQIVYWHLPDKDGNSKMRVEKEGHKWVAKRREDWWEEIRVKPKQADRALADLGKAGIVHTRVFRFDGSPTVHIRIDEERFLEVMELVTSGKWIFPREENPTSSKGKMETPQKGKSIHYTENTGRDYSIEKKDPPLSDFPNKPPDKSHVFSPVSQESGQRKGYSKESGKVNGRSDKPEKVGDIASRVFSGMKYEDAA